MIERIASPVDTTVRPLIEERKQPLYDCDVFSVNTRLIDFFQVPIGNQTVAGNVALGANVLKTIRHTNMTQGGFLPSPKLFKIEGVRISVAEAPAYTSSTPASVVENVYYYSGDHVQVTVEQWIRYLMWYELRVGGGKPYAIGPGYFFPANRGCGLCIGSVSLGQRVAAIAGPAYIGVVSEAAACHGAGLYWSLGRNSVTIAPNQQFRGRLRTAGIQLGTNFYSVITTIDSNQIHRLVYNFLDGIYGVEVQ